MRQNGMEQVLIEKVLIETILVEEALVRRSCQKAFARRSWKQDTVVFGGKGSS
jgi:hypothetical protein